MTDPLESSNSSSSSPDGVHQVRRHESPDSDESITATTSETGHVQITKVVIPESVEKAAAKIVTWFLPMLIVTACLLALSIAMNVAAYFKMRDVDTRRWLHDYDLNQFQNGDFARLKTEVETMKQVDDKVMSLFGPNSTQCKRTP